MWKKLAALTRDPGAEFRAKPFWAWNGKLDPDELRWQIRRMRDMGLGGFFMHSRVGLDTEYLGKEWFRAVDACVDEAKKLGMEAWLYDEDRWPSGAAGGLVTKNHAYRHREIRPETVPAGRPLAWDANTVGACVLRRVDDGTVADIRPIVQGGAKPGKGKAIGKPARGSAVPKPGPGEELIRFQIHVDGDSSWYNGQAYLDTLSHDAVKAFLRTTYDAYKKNNASEFGRAVPGVFTDEPNFGRCCPPDALVLPWTAKLPAVFRRRYGYDLLPRLAELFWDIEGQAVSRARYHYHDCLSFLFSDAFGRLIGEWCGQNKLQYTGHLLCEDNLFSMVNTIGDPLRFYEHMQAPGIDLLTERARLYPTAKQCSSVARQFGRRWRLTETYGCTGWDFALCGHKALSDWQLACGVNLRAPHLSWYTMLAEAKRDYPACIHYQSPWAGRYRVVEDYFARAGAIMDRGAETRDILVLHPVESMFTKVKAGWHQDPAAGRLDHQWAALCSQLLARHLDFDYGGEDTLSRHGSVTRAGELKVGQAAYRAVVVPHLFTIRSSTLALLDQFQKAGGRVIFAGEAADHVDAEPSSAAAELAKRCLSTSELGDDLWNALAAVRRVSVVDASGREADPVLALLRQDKDAYYLFLVNTGENAPPAEPGKGSILWDHPRAEERRLALEGLKITLLDGEAAGRPLEYIAETDEYFTPPAARGPKGWTVEADFPPLASRIFIFPRKADKGADAADALPPPRPSSKETRKHIPEGPRNLEGAWEFGLSEANVYVLDQPRWRLDQKGEWKKAEEILKVDRAVRERLGLQARGGAMVQPWARPRLKNPKCVTVSLAYDFAVGEKAGDLPSGELWLAVERPETMAIRLNGQPVSTDAPSGWWVDKSLIRVPLDPSLLRAGANVLEMDCEYSETHSGLEIAYLLGNFGVAWDADASMPKAITRRPDSLRIGDWVTQGLPFYAGHVAYRIPITPKIAPGERVFLRTPSYRGAAVRILVDGQEAGLSAWAPHEVEITRWVKNGQPALLTVEVLGNRRNSHGPLHLKDQWPGWTGPAEYQPGDDRWKDGYNLVPLGLMAPPELVCKA